MRSSKIFLLYFSCISLVCVSCGGDSSQKSTSTSADTDTQQCQAGDTFANCQNSVADETAEHATEWVVQVDRAGYGIDSLQAYTVSVTSVTEDSDGDGLSNGNEYIHKTDPHLADTDGDGLTDFEEVSQWLTNPTSVDTDGDSRGSGKDLPPDSAFFDGNELAITAGNPFRTSPSLADTDADGRSDFREVKILLENPLIADLPKFEIEIIDPIDVRLNIEYAEEEGQSKEYSTEVTRSTQNTHNAQYSYALSATLEVGAEVSIKAGALDWGAAKTTVNTTIGATHTFGYSFETAIGFQNAYTNQQQDSRTRTESASSGSMSAGIAIRNTGETSFSMQQLGITVRQAQPDQPDDDESGQLFKTLATLTPHIDNVLTLSPGASTPVLEFEATDVNADRIKMLMRTPTTMLLEAAHFEIEDSNGLNVDYIKEVTRNRTARVVIDYGDGYALDHLIATNVNRSSTGQLSGLGLNDIITNILSLEFETVPRQQLYPTSESNEQVLDALWHPKRNSFLRSEDDIQTGFWAVFVRSNGGNNASANFEDIVIQAGDELILTYISDKDGDGLFSYEEQIYLTEDDPLNSENSTDTDGDGISDKDELAAEGCVTPSGDNSPCAWVVTISGQAPYAVTSDPRNPDQDGDGWNDGIERDNGTDPTNSDTDQDGLSDSSDPFPKTPAIIYYVSKDGGDGSGLSWATAFTELFQAIDAARIANSDTDEANDVSEIWVKQGLYFPTNQTSNTKERMAATFGLLNNVGIYGGFNGSESKRSQRITDHYYNGTVLSCDYEQNDQPQSTVSASDFDDNCLNVFWSIANNSTAILDGFTITGGYADGRARTNDDTYQYRVAGGGMIVSGGNPSLKNLLFKDNFAHSRGGALDIVNTNGMELNNIVFEGNWLNPGNATLNNSTQGGAIYYGNTTLHNSGEAFDLTVAHCEFINNVHPVYVFANGGSKNTTLITNSIFYKNYGVVPESLTSQTGPSTISGLADHFTGIYYNNGNHIIKNTVFKQQRIEDLRSTPPGKWANLPLIQTGAKSSLSFVQNLLWDTGYKIRTSEGGNQGGSGIGFRALAQSQIDIVNATIVGDMINDDYSVGDITPFYIDDATIRVRNSIINWENPFGAYEGDVIWEYIVPNSGGSISYKDSCVHLDAAFDNQEAGQFSLSSDSPCIDFGNNYVDSEPFTQGLQLLPSGDLNGEPRFVDADGDGVKTVDAGAFEYQEPVW
ncbi:hypothetical protein SAMN02745866_04273 [Alteromonadaceae bacterium Bs31]|nr:hypothetical protein SAMN02745866_04273 [Alteromonadaceae bacterium Bs31]